MDIYSEWNLLLVTANPTGIINIVPGLFWIISGLVAVPCQHSYVHTRTVHLAERNPGQERRPVTVCDYLALHCLPLLTRKPLIINGQTPPRLHPNTSSFYTLYFVFFLRCCQMLTGIQVAIIPRRRGLLVFGYSAEDRTEREGRA